MIIFKSKLYREEIKHWIMTVALLAWALVTTCWALSRKDKVIVIAIDGGQTRIVDGSQNIQGELKQFVRQFIDQYYSYNEKTFSKQVGEAANLMSADLWEKEKGKLVELKAKLEQSPLSQTAEMVSADVVGPNHIEAILKIGITSRLTNQAVQLKVVLKFADNVRSETNPWNYQITEVSDVVN